MNPFAGLYHRIRRTYILAALRGRIDHQSRTIADLAERNALLEQRNRELRYTTGSQAQTIEAITAQLAAARRLAAEAISERHQAVEAFAGMIESAGVIIVHPN